MGWVLWSDNMRGIQNILRSIVSPNIRRGLDWPAKLFQGTLGPGSVWRAGHSPLRAMKEVRTVYSCVQLIASAVLSTPLVMYRRTDDKGSFTEARQHPLYDLLKYSPDREITAAQFLEHLMRSVLLYGNGYARILENGAGEVMSLRALDPRHVLCLRTKEGNLVYDVKDWDGLSAKRLLAPEILHIAGPGWDGCYGKSPIQEAASSVAYSAAVRGYADAFLENGAIPAVVLTTDQAIPKDIRQQNIAEWNKRYSGGGRHKTALLDRGFKAEPLAVNPQDAQLLEAMKWTVSDICGIFAVPPHMVAALENATYSNVEHQGIQFVVQTLLPWFTRVEQAITLQLMTREERREYYVKFRVPAMQRGDFETRMKGYATGRQWGWLSANDVRKLEDMPPVDGGDMYLAPLNMLDIAGRGLDEGRGILRDEEDIHKDILPPQKNKSNIAREEGPGQLAMDRRYAAQSLLDAYIDAFRGLSEKHGEALLNIVEEFPEGGSELRRRLYEWTSEEENIEAETLIQAYDGMLAAMLLAAQYEVGFPEDPPVEITSDLETAKNDISISAAQRLATQEVASLWDLVEDGTYEEASELTEKWLEPGGLAHIAARDELTRSENALTREIWLAGGVLYMTWRNVGRGCPICQQMEGRRRRVSSTFVDPGESIGSLSVSRRIATPPLHKGCDCIIIPG